MTPRLFLRAAAKADLRDAFEWYEARSTNLGFEFLRAARTVLALVERNPAQFAVVLDDIRGHICSAFSVRCTTSSEMSTWW